MFLWASQGKSLEGQREYQLGNWLANLKRYSRAKNSEPNEEEQLPGTTLAAGVVCCFQASLHVFSWWEVYKENVSHQVNPFFQTHACSGGVAQTFNLLRSAAGARMRPRPLLTRLIWNVLALSLEGSVSFSSTLSPLDFYSLFLGPSHALILLMTMGDSEDTETIFSRTFLWH